MWTPSCVHETTRLPLAIMPRFKLIAASVLFLATTACSSSPPIDGAQPEAVSYEIVLENTSALDALDTSAGKADIVLAPGVWAVLTSGTLFKAGGSASTGMEALAEDGNNGPFLSDLKGQVHIDQSEILGASHGTSYDDAPILPGDVVTVKIDALSDQRFGLAAMFAHSNDIMIALPPEGVALDTEPGATTDITAQLAYWDVGTEQNEEPAVGANQPGKQSEAGAGDLENGTITKLDNNKDSAGFSYPAIGDFARLTLKRVE